MFLLTPTERKVLIFIGLLILTGSLLHFLDKSGASFNLGVTEPNRGYTAAKKNQIGIVNVNKAAAEELAKLPGIGIKTAELIVQYRSKFGKFESLNDLKKVKGIGDRKIEKIKEYTVY